MEDLDFGESIQKIDIKLKHLGAGVVAVVVVVALLFLAFSAINQPPISMQFTNPSVAPGGGTVLEVVVVNIADSDASPVSVSLAPESSALMVTNPTRIEPTIGAKARRAFQFPVSVSPTVTRGTYRLTATVTGISEEPLVASTYLEVA